MPATFDPYAVGIIVIVGVALALAAWCALWNVIGRWRIDHAGPILTSEGTPTFLIPAKKPYALTHMALAADDWLAADPPTWEWPAPLTVREAPEEEYAPGDLGGMVEAQIQRHLRERDERILGPDAWRQLVKP